MARTRAQSEDPSKRQGAKSSGAQSKVTKPKKPEERAKSLSPIEGSPSPPPTPPAQDGNVQSPTTSEGPEFTFPENVPVEAIAAARQGRYTITPHGYHNTDNDKCYRNALVVLLLSSDRLMSWIEHRYVPNLQAAGVTIKTNVGEVRERLDNADSKSKKTKNSKDKFSYTDVWCELKELHSLNVHPRANLVKRGDLTSAMGKFWQWLKKQSAQEEKITGSLWDDRFYDQQDSHEFMMWLLALNEKLLKELVERLISQPAAKQIYDARVKLADTHSNELITIFNTMRAVCVQCGHERNAAIRVKKPSGNPYLSISMNYKDGTQRPRTREIEELISDDLKNSNEGFRCENCYNKFEQWKRKEQLKARALGKDAQEEAEKAIAKKNDQYLSLKSYQGKGLCTLPEVLIVQLIRFDSTTKRGKTVTKKTKAKVKYGEVLDLGPFMEKRMPKRSSTRYRLVGVTHHDGDLQTGHFFNNVYAGGSWYMVDSEKVTLTSFHEIYNKSYGDPYMFMYERIRENDDTDDSYCGISKDGDAKHTGRGKGDDRGAAGKTGTGKDAGVQKTTAKGAKPEKSVVQKDAAQKAAAQKNATGKVDDVKDVTKDVAPKKTSPKKATPEKALPTRVSPGRSTPQKPSPTRVSPRRITPDKAINEKDTADQDAADKEANTEEEVVEATVEEGYVEAGDIQEANVEQTVVQDTTIEDAILELLGDNYGDNLQEAADEALLNNQDDQTETDVLPTWSRLGQTKHLQLAKDGASPGPGQLAVDVKAMVNGYSIKFPRYFLGGFNERLGLYNTEIELGLTDNRNAGARVAATGDLCLVRPSSRESAPPATTGTRGTKRKNSDEDNVTTKNKRQKKRESRRSAVVNDGNEEDDHIEGTTHLGVDIDGGDKDYETTPEQERGTRSGSGDDLASLFESPLPEQTTKRKRGNGSGGGSDDSLASLFESPEEQQKHGRKRKRALA